MFPPPDPRAHETKTPAQRMIDFVCILLSSLESKVMLEEQRRALCSVVGRFHVAGMPEPMSDKEFKESRESIQRYRSLLAVAPFLSELAPEQLEVFFVLFLSGVDEKSAIAQAKQGLTVDGKIALMESFKTGK